VDINIINCLNRAAIFQPLTPIQREEIAKNCDLVIYNDQQVLFRQGARNINLFIIFDGQVSLFISGNDGQMQLTKHLGPGELVGEQSALTSQPPKFTAIAQGSVELVRINVGKLSKIVSDFSILLKAISQIPSVPFNDEEDDDFYEEDQNNEQQSQFSSADNRSNSKLQGNGNNPQPTRSSSHKPISKSVLTSNDSVGRTAEINEQPTFNESSPQAEKVKNKLYCEATDLGKQITLLKKQLADLKKQSQTNERKIDDLENGRISDNDNNVVIESPEIINESILLEQELKKIIETIDILNIKLEDLTCDEDKKQKQIRDLEQKINLKNKDLDAKKEALDSLKNYQEESYTKTEVDQQKRIHHQKLEILIKTIAFILEKKRSGCRQRAFRKLSTISRASLAKENTAKLCQKEEEDEEVWTKRLILLIGFLCLLVFVYFTLIDQSTCGMNIFGRPLHHDEM